VYGLGTTTVPPSSALASRSSQHQLHPRASQESGLREAAALTLLELGRSQGESRGEDRGQIGATGGAYSSQHGGMQGGGMQGER
jgi:hypothetical protein